MSSCSNLHLCRSSAWFQACAGRLVEGARRCRKAHSLWHRPDCVPEEGGSRGAAGGEEPWRAAPGLNTARGVDTDFSEQERLIWGDSGSEIRGDFKEVAFVLTLGGRCIWERQSVRGGRGEAGLCVGDPCVLPGRLGVDGARPWRSGRESSSPWKGQHHEGLSRVRCGPAALGRNHLNPGRGCPGWGAPATRAARCGPWEETWGW